MCYSNADDIIEDLQFQIDRLDDENRRLEEENSALHDQIQQLENDTKDLAFQRKEADRYSDMVDELEEELSELERIGERNERTESALQAYLDATYRADWTGTERPPLGDLEEILYHLKDNSTQAMSLIRNERVCKRTTFIGAMELRGVVGT